MTNKQEENNGSGKLLAIEEMKILSSIIGRIENAIYQKQGWLFTLITGLALAVLKDDPLICKQQFVAISIPVTILFLIADGIQRVPVHRAIKRSQKVEESLRKNTDFDSPTISDSLGNGNNILDFIHAVRRFRVWTPYAFIVAIVGVIWCITP